MRAARLAARQAVAAAGVGVGVGVGVGAGVGVGVGAAVGSGVGAGVGATALGTVLGVGCGVGVAGEPQAASRMAAAAATAMTGRLARTRMEGDLVSVAVDAFDAACRVSIGATPMIRRGSGGLAGPPRALGGEVLLQQTHQLLKERVLLGRPRADALAEDDWPAAVPGLED